MVTLIESLKLVSDIDASGYARGAKEIDAANASISQSSRAAGAAVTDANQRISRSGDALSQLERQYVAGARQAQTFEAGLRRLGTVVEKDASQMERAIQVLAGMQEKFGMTANAAVLAERGWMGAARIAEILASSASRASQSQMGMAISADEMARSAAALRAQIDPLGTAQARMNAEIAEYNTLAARGAITATELAKAQELARQRMAATAQRAHPAANDNAAGFRQQNLGYQMQDIGVSLYGGMPIGTVLIQQGSQIIGLYQGNGGVNAALKDFTAIVKAAVQYAAPFAAIGALAYGAYKLLGQYSAEAAAAVDDLTKSLAAQAKPLESLRGQIDNLASLQKTYNQAVLDGAKSSDEATTAIIANSEREYNARKALLELEEKKQKALLRTQQAELLTHQIRLRGELARAVTTRTDLQAQGFADPAIGSVPFVRLPDSVTGLQKTLETIEKSPAADQIKALRAQLELTEIGVEQLGKALEKTFNASPYGDGKGGLPIIGPIPQAKPLMDERPKGAYENLIVTANERLAQMRLEIDTAGRGAAAVEALRMKQDLLNAAMYQYGEITPTVTAKIDDLTREYERNALAIDKARLASDLLFEREQMGRNPVEQRVATAMRGLYGDDYKTQMNSYEAGLIRGNEQARVMQDELRAVGDLGKDAFMGIAEALTTAGNRGDKLLSVFAGIGRKFAEMGMERLWKNIEEGRDLFSVPERPKASPVTAMTMGRELGATIAPAISQNLTSSLSTWAAAVRKIESGSYAGNYSAMGPVTKSGDRAYGAYQVMGRNIEPWTKEVLGQSLSIKEFIADRAAQDKVFYTKFGQSMDKFGNMADATSVWFTGRPLSRAGNASDGYNTAPQYLSKVQGAVDAYPGIGKAEVSAGVVDASRKLKQQDAHVQAWQNQGGGAGGFPGGDLGKALGIGSAAFGAFAGGYQSGDPLSGGISGAMGGLGLASAGLMAAGPAIVIGAVLGIVGGMIGRAKQKRQELQQAQQELENQMGAINQLIAKSTGNYLGSFQKQFSDTTDELNKAIALARKAKNTALVTELEGAMKEFFTDLSARWNRGYEGMIASMEAGKGMDGAFLSGMDAVEKMRESLVGFVNDAKFFAEANGDLAKAHEKMRNKGKEEEQILYRYRPTYEVSPGSDGFSAENRLTAGYLDLGNQMVEKGVAAWTEKGGQLYSTTEELRRAAVAAGLAIDDLGKVTRAAVAPTVELTGTVERARQAAIATALASIGGAKEFTAIEEAIQKLQGAAATLPSLLSDLGMSAADAAKAIDGEMLTAMKKMRQSFKDEMISSMNSLSGVGYLNDLVEAQKLYERRMKDSAALGIDGSLAMRGLSLSIKDIVKNAGLGREEVELLAGSFPELQFALKGWLDADPAKKILSVADATTQLQAAYDKESGALKNMIDRLKSFADALAKFREGMKLGSSSPLGPREKLEEAARQFSEMAAKARGGDEKAMADLTGISQNYLDEARSYYASSTQYFDIWKDVDRTLGDLQSEGAKSLSVAERQLKALDDSVSGILKLNDTVLSLKDALAAYTAAKADDTKALREALGRMAEKPITQMYQDSLNRAPDAGGLSYWQNRVSSGTSLADVATQISTGPEAQIRKAYEQIMGREADQSGLSFFMGSGKSIEQIQADLTYAKKMGAFAAGGFHGGGLRLVGEEGPEIEATGPSRIWSASQTREILSGSGGNNAELVAELRAMRRELAAANEEIAALRKVTAAGVIEQIGEQKRQTAVLADVSGDLRRAGASR